MSVTQWFLGGHPATLRSMKMSNGDDLNPGHQYSSAEARKDAPRLAAYQWERLGLLCVVGMVFFILIVIACVGYRYIHLSFPVTPTALR